MENEFLSKQLSTLYTAKSKDRHRIYDDIVNRATTDPLHLSEATTELSTVDDYYSRNALQKISDRVYDRFFKGEQQPTITDMQCIVEHANTPQQDIMSEALRGYFARPVHTLQPDQMTPESIQAACEQTVDILAPFALAMAQEQDYEKQHTMIDVWYRLSDPAQQPFTLSDILGFGSKQLQGPIAQQSAAIRDILNSIEVIHKGEFAFKSNDNDKLEWIMNKVGKMTDVFAIDVRDVPQTRIDFLNGQVILPNVMLIRNKAVGFNYCSIEFSPDILESTAVQYNLQKWAHLLTNDGVLAHTLRLPGAYHTLIMNSGGKSEAEEHEFIRQTILDRIQQLRQRMDPPIPFPQILPSELGTICDYCMPEITSQTVTEDITKMKDEAAAGLYSLSRRGDRIVFDPKTEGQFTQLGIDSITFKKLGNTTVASLSILGSPVRCFLDVDYAIHVEGDLSPKAEAWISTIVYSYLSELRNNKSGSTQRREEQEQPIGETPAVTSAGEPASHKGVRPYLRVLAEGFHTSINAEINEQVKENFGYSLSEINYYFGLVQMKRDVISEFPPRLARMIENLLSRIERKGVQPRWVETPAPLMLLDNPRSAEEYDPLTSVFRVSFVDEYHAEVTTPKEVKCPGAIGKIQEIMSRA